MQVRRIHATLELLAPEEEQLLLILVEPRERHRPADRVAAVVARRRRLRDGRRHALVQPGVAIPRRTAAVPVAGPVKVTRPALGDDLHLSSDRAPVLRL